MAVLVLKYYLSADAQKLTGGKLKMRGDMAMKLMDAEWDGWSTDGFPRIELMT